MSDLAEGLSILSARGISNYVSHDQPLQLPVIILSFFSQKSTSAPKVVSGSSERLLSKVSQNLSGSSYQKAVVGTDVCGR